MKVVIINAQKGKSIPLYIAREFVKYISPDEKAGEYNLPEDIVFRTNEEKEELFSLLDETEVIIVAIPDYSETEIGSIKAFLDSYFLCYHLDVRKDLYKQAVLVSSDSSRRASLWHKEIYSDFIAWGIKLTYKLSLNYQGMEEKNLSDKDKAKISHKVLNLSKLLLKNNGKSKASSYLLFRLYALSASVRGHWIPTSITRWLRKGWIKSVNDAKEK